MEVIDNYCGVWYNIFRVWLWEDKFNWSRIVFPETFQGKPYMKNLMATVIVVYLVLMAGAVTLAVLPDIKAGGSDGPVNIAQSENLLVTVQLDREGDSAFVDWWVAANTPFGWYSYNPGVNSWISGFHVAHQGPLIDLSPREIVNISGLPLGTYSVYFGVDMIRNGTLDMSQANYDSVAVEISENAPDDPEEYIPAAPDPAYDYFTWTLPTGASSVRLSLPAYIDNFLLSSEGGIGGYGIHAGGHIEGLDHVWIELIKGVPFKSWADGTITDIRWNNGEYHIYIDYGDNLEGIHMEVETPYVSVGDHVTRGQVIGLGGSFGGECSSAELTLIDRGRTDGPTPWGGGANVSPFDYLRPADKQLLVDTYKEKVIDPYVASGTRAWGFQPEQPYLTNNIFIHDGNEGKLTGSWYLTSAEFAVGYPNDYFFFMEASNPYYTGNVVKAQDRDLMGGDHTIREGTFEVDYAAGRVKMINPDSWPEKTYYGIFQIDESNDQAVLKIEYQEGSYPSSFSSNALYYIEKGKQGLTN